ncbi:hypothetical protein [Pseudoxanthomonas yeongjuensis]|uniref:hypothetical protein n=1 Tax=Pseudoxanthomonas yeongjuensis TaxID=377616 RepID=UPI001391E768|nr:hypothetical protein [Pseudoxanthomonas yeongjuensis]
MLWLLVSDYGLVNPFTKAQLQWNAAGVGPAGSRRRARRVGTDGGKPSRDGCGLFAPVDADKKTPASRRTRVRYREWSGVFLEEAKPASVMPRARVGGRFVLLDVEMTRLACFRRKCLLGRNLITLFQCVNSFAKIFLPGSVPGALLRRIAFPRIGTRDTHRAARRNQALLKNAAFNALFPQRLFRTIGTTRAFDA